MSDTRLNKSVTEPYFDDELPEALPADPLHRAEAWLAAATERAEQPNPNAMTLSTIDGKGRPSSRVVLCKAFVANPGYLVFYTNYASQKGQEIAGDSRICCIFHWDHVGRQVRLEGVAVKSPAEESDQYFASRHRGSQLGAWGSDQSRPHRIACGPEKAVAATRCGTRFHYRKTAALGRLSNLAGRRRTLAGRCRSHPRSRALDPRTATGRRSSLFRQCLDRHTPATLIRRRMDDRLQDRRISCPYCGETIEIVIDVSAGSQSYVEDCQVCCRPMNVSFEVLGDGFTTLRVERGD